MIYIFVPIALMALAILFTVVFPVKKKEFEIVKRDIARRKGENVSNATPEEKVVLEKVTGFRYEELWNRDNALKLKGVK